MKRKYKSQVKLPRDTEDWFIKNVEDDVYEMLDYLAGLEGDQDIKDHVAEGIGNLEDLIRALVDQTNIPKKGLKRPWDVNKMN